MDTERAIRRITHKASLVKVKRAAQRGAIKSVGHSHMECGGKRSATSLFLVFVLYPFKTSRSSQSGVALRSPPHSISLINLKASEFDCSSDWRDEQIGRAAE